MPASKITPQAVGAYGERAVEAELLRHRWIPANVNATVKNAADFDIYALKQGRTVHLRVRACGPNLRAFQFGGFIVGKAIEIAAFSDLDFTILVGMGTKRIDDQFYVLPTHIVREEIALRRQDYLRTVKRDGNPRKDTGHWTLRLAERQDGRQEGGYGLEKKWSHYLNAWNLLDAPGKTN